MRTMWSNAKAQVDHRLARAFCTQPFRLANDRAVVSFTFDDIPKNAATVGAAILDEYDAKGTFYVAGGLIGTPAELWEAADTDDVAALHAAGHEVACHTFSHPRVSDLDARTLAREIEQNRRFFTAVDSSMRIENFAYPYGIGSLARKRELGAVFRSSRGTVPGVNSGVVDLQFLRAVPLIDGWIDHREIDRVFGEAERDNGWLIFYTHDVDARPSPYGCSPDLLHYALKAATGRKLPTLSMTEALTRVGA